MDLPELTMEELMDEWSKTYFEEEEDEMYEMRGQILPDTSLPGLRFHTID
jgi:hypothetical protein